MRPAPRRAAPIRSADLEPGSAAVLVEAVAEVGAGEPRPTVTLERVDRPLGVERPERVHRMAELPVGDDRRSSIGRRVARVERHAVVDGPGNRLQPVHVVGHRQRGARPAAVVEPSTFQDARARGLGGRTPPSVCRTTRLVEYSKPPSARARAASASASRRRASSAWVAMTTASKRSRAEPAVRTVTPAPSRTTATTGSPRPHGPGRQAADESLDVGLRPTRARRAIAAPAVADQAVVVEEAEQVVDRELEDAVGDRRPDRGRDREQEVLAECPAVAAARRATSPSVAEVGSGASRTRRASR